MLTDFSFVRYIVAITFTALSYLAGIYIVQRKLKVIGSAAIGCLVVTIGYVSAILKFPILLIFLLPFPFGFFGLYLISDRSIKKTFYSYGAVWIVYIIFHVILSGIFHFHSLIPPWKLSS